MTLLPQFVADMQTRMQVISEDEYNRFTQSQNIWYPEIVIEKATTAKRDIFAWLLDTATIKDQGKGGNIAFDEQVSKYTEIETRHAGAGLKIFKDRLVDDWNGITGGEGLNLAAEWTRKMGAYMSYWPQKKAAEFLKTAHLLGTAGGFTAYDGKAFFAADHPINPFNTGAGTYANLFTGSASAGVTPGALPIDVSQTADVALANLTKAMSYIASIKMPNGEDPRFLTPRAILAGPTLMPRVAQLTNAKFIAQAAGSSAASADVEALIATLGYGQPIMAKELAGFESDTTYFIIAEQVTSSALGALIYMEREPFHITYYEGLTIAELDRADELEWHVKGRNAIAPGHPFYLFKVKAS